jgi:pilus assembly protein FimV
VVEQYTEIQYDDDLTDGNAEYDDSYYTGAEDLFDYTPDEESPISRLKSLVLSIDWEITDEILMEFNEELVDLKDIWAGDKINLVYVQALEKLSKYIYQKKAASHPSAIKLLLTLYHNLEKIVLSDDLSEAEKKEILLEDVKRFEDLKSHLKKPETGSVRVKTKAIIPDHSSTGVVAKESQLRNLKAIVLGIDWEITDDDLSALRQEVVRLEKLFAGSRPRLILLQGIGTIGAYIKVKKSDSHADAFKVLHHFYESLEKIVDTPMSVEEEKAVLFPAVDRFNEFKKVLGETISPESISRSEKDNQEDGPGVFSGTFTPAFSELSEDDAIGFQADKEAAALGIESPDKVNDHVANFFGEDSFVDERETSKKLSDTFENQFAEIAQSEPEVIEKNIALQGVDVEEGDEEDLAQELITARQDDVVTPALSFEDDTLSESPVAQISDNLANTTPSAIVDSEIDNGESLLEVTFPDDGEEDIVADFTAIDKNVALQGVDVESDADDDSDEDDLPLLEGQLAPALADNDEISIYNAVTVDGIAEEPEGLDDVIAGTVLGFFEEDNPTDTETTEESDTDDQEPFRLDEDLSFEPEVDGTDSLSVDLETELSDSFPASYDEFDSTVSLSTQADDDLDSDFSSDIEGQLDDFFGSDDKDGDEPFNEMFAGEAAPALGEVSAENIEEEVVFELVEETIEFDSVVESTVTTAVSTLSGSLDEDTLSVAPFDDVSLGEQENESVSDNLLENLATAVEATGLELEDNVLIGLLDEIDVMDKLWKEKPLEQTFLHLLRTIGRHIDRYRYEAGSKSYELLKSVFDALVLSQTAVDQRQDLLLAQTVRVLDWQQSIISTDSSKSADRAIISEPLLVQELGDTGGQALTFEDELLDDANGGTDGHSNSYNQNEVTGNLKDEITSLRKSLQDEISELKKG